SARLSFRDLAARVDCGAAKASTLPSLSPQKVHLSGLRLLECVRAPAFSQKKGCRGHTDSFCCANTSRRSARIPSSHPLLALSVSSLSFQREPQWLRCRGWLRLAMSMPSPCRRPQEFAHKTCRL